MADIEIDRLFVRISLIRRDTGGVKDGFFWRGKGNLGKAGGRKRKRRAGCHVLGEMPNQKVIAAVQSTARQGEVRRSERVVSSPAKVERAAAASKW